MSDSTRDISANVAASRKLRSRLSNGSTVHLFGDGRSAGARRYRDLLAEFAVELGGMDALPETGKQLVRRLAQLCVEAEIMEAMRARGEAIDPVAYATLTNVQRRLLRDFEAHKARRTDNPDASPLAAYLAARMAANGAPEVA